MTVLCLQLPGQEGKVAGAGGRHSGELPHIDLLGGGPFFLLPSSQHNAAAWEGARSGSWAPNITVNPLSLNQPLPVTLGNS